ncbi:bile salt sulfotransferase [Tupaia chinensis]|uniref:bile salt sulfotransferase n=1 Tax=Tupaia chinensis TaxID=246437 RepID=UPI0003C8F88E|nr:bile salt sulfotransferase [Tupaia chinensis]
MSDDYMWFEGIPFPSAGCSHEIFREVRDKFVFKNDDVLLVSYPKSGTNWLIEILSLIHSKGDPKEIQSVPIWNRSPWIDTEEGYKSLCNKEGPRLMTSHLPIHLMSKSIFSAKTKVIYLMRNPRDILVSGYYFWKETNLTKKPKSLEQYFEWFIQGNVVYGSWFDHIRDWMTMKGRENFLILNYEEMKRDTRSGVEKICQFLGKKLEPEEVNLVLKYSSFQAMKKNKMSNYSLLHGRYLNSNTLIVRKGICEDWKNHFTVAQAEAFDKIFQEKMANLPQELFLWD